MATIVALVPHPDLSRKLRVAVRGLHELYTCGDWASLFRCCQEKLIHVAIIDLPAGGNSRFDPVRRLRSLHPRIILVAHLADSSGRVRDIFDAGRYGFDGLITADRDYSPKVILELIAQAERSGVSNDVARLLDKFPENIRDAILLSVTRAHEPQSASTVARILGLSTNQLGRMLSAAALPGMTRILTWGRLIVAGYLLEDQSRSADSIARLLSFPSGSAFRNSCRRYVGMSPGEIRAAGGSSAVIRAFASELKL